MRTITPFLYWETLNTNDGILFIPTNNEASDRMAIYTIDKVTDSIHATARLRHASFNAPANINLTRTNGQLTTTDLADLKANGETRVIIHEPDEYETPDGGYNIWAILQATENYEDTDTLPQTFNIPETNTAPLTPETALALHDTLNHPEYHTLHNNPNHQETLEEALTSLWQNISDYYAIPNEMHWVSDTEILWRTKDYLTTVHDTATKEGHTDLANQTNHHINTITNHPYYEE